MVRYKLIALDMDGTLLDEEKKISAENKEWIRKAREAGITVMMSTGRGIQNISRYVEELGLDAPIVAVNGSEVWLKPGVLGVRHTLVHRDVEAMLRMGCAYDSVWYWGYSSEGLHTKDSWNADLQGEEWLKFGFYTEDDMLRHGIRTELEAWGTLEVTNSHPCNLEINPLGVSKASGLRYLCDRLGIRMDEVVAMGDSLNDLSMIREAGLGVAMGNAQEEVKRQSDHVTVSNVDNGVALVIRELVLGLPRE